MGLQDLVVLACRHTFHSACIGETMVCSLCNKVTTLSPDLVKVKQ